MIKGRALVSVITVNYNGKRHLKHCFDSLYSLNYPKSKIEIIMVDNGSIDSSIDFVEENYPKIRIICNDENNYCRANNLGIKGAKGDYIALINNDTRVHKNWLIELMEVIGKDKTIGVVGSKILFQDGKINSTSHSELPNFYWVDRGFREDDYGQYNKVEEVSSVSGCSALYRKEIFKSVGFFDEDFEMFAEDVDMSIRLRTESWRVFYCPSSIVYHKYRGTADDDLALFYTERNRLFVVAKHFPERLGEAILGRGYFTVRNNIAARNDIYSVLPAVLSKLVKCNNSAVVESVLPNLFENLKKVTHLEKDYLVNTLDRERIRLGLKDKELGSKNVLLQERESGLREKAEQISSLTRNLHEKEEEVKSLGEQTNNLTWNLHQKEHEADNLRAFYSTETYRFVVRPLWALLDLIKRILRAFGILRKSMSILPIGPGRVSDKQISNQQWSYERPSLDNYPLACTIVSKNYLPYAITLADSLRQENPNWCFKILLCDLLESKQDLEIIPLLLKKDIEVIPIYDLLNYVDIPELDSMLFKYDITEMNTAIKPFFLEYLFLHGHSKIVYVDPDILVLDSFDEIERLLDENSIILTPHIFENIPADGKKADELGYFGCGSL